MRRSLAALGVIILGAATAMATAVQIDELRPPDRVLHQRVAYPDAERLRPLCFGHTEVAADLAWIQILMYYGLHMLRDEQVPWLDRMTETAVGLDPRFEGAYRWAVTAATWRKRTRPLTTDYDVRLANHYAEMGMRRRPDSWQFPYLLGATWYYDRDDLPRTRYYWSKAAEYPDAPEHLLENLATINRRMGDLDKAIMRLGDLIPITTEPGQREMLQHRLEFLRKQLQAQQQGGH